MADRTDWTAGFSDAQPGLERAKAIVTEFTDAAGSTALSLANEQKERAARQVEGVAEAVRSAARSLERAQSPTIARYADRTAGQIEELSRALRQRRWGELVGDVEELARRQPVLFVVGAVILGFVTGRFLSLRQQDDTWHSVAVDALPPADPVTAAVSSAGGNGKLGGWSNGSSQPREFP